MPSPWRLLTVRGKLFAIGGLVTCAVCIFAGQHDVARVGLFLLLLPVIAGVLVTRAGLRMSCERAVEPAQAPLGSKLVGRIKLAQQGRLPAGIIFLEDQVPTELGDRPRFLVDKAAFHWRREVDYPLLGEVRGRFCTGPLLVRTTDPFGLVRIDRQFTATSEVLITPTVVPLPAMRTAGGAGSTGQVRPHRIGIGGSDDALIREYREGDDMRRIHWRSTARRGEVMVRREEQSWDPSASIILDSRAAAHRGSGPDSSLEWAISAVASVAMHFLDNGFGIEMYEANGPLRLYGTRGQHATTTRDLVLNRLTDLRASSARSLWPALELAAVDRAGQLVVAVLGEFGVADANALVRVRRQRAQGLALVLDVESFGRPIDSTRGSRAGGRQSGHSERAAAMEILRDHQWRVVEVCRGTGVDQAWATLDQLGAAA